MFYPFTLETVEKRSIFRESRVILEGGSAAEAGLQGRSPTRDRDVLGLVEHRWIEIIDYDSDILHASTHPEGAAAD